MSSRDLLEQSDRIEPLIRMLLNDEPFEVRPSSRQLGTSLGLWYVTPRRAADSGVAAWRALDRPWRGGRPSKRDALARWEAMVDYSSAFTIGAMVLEDFGYCELERRDALPQKKRSNYWPEFVTHVDPLDDDVDSHGRVAPSDVVESMDGGDARRASRSAPWHVVDGRRRDC